MATLIICPVCETRYEVKAAFPPEGRKVRCSKCGHVWQAQPVASAPDPFAPKPAPAPKPKASPAPAPASATPSFSPFPSVKHPAPPPPSPEPSLTDRLSETKADAEFDVGDDLAA